MRLIKKIILFSVFVGLLFSCMDDVPVIPVQADHSNYFPLNKGSYYKYEVIQTDTNGNVTNSNRVVRFTSDTIINRAPYVIQIDSLRNEGLNSTSSSFIRKTSSGVFYFTDTTGFIDLFPDSLKENVGVQPEMRTQLFPLLDGSAWTVYRISVKLFDLLNYNVVDIAGHFIDDEEMTITIAGEPETIKTKKIEYVYKLRLDTSGNPIVFNSRIWLAEDIGIVKLEGSAVLLSIFGGGLLISTDTSINVTQYLVDYYIKGVSKN
jgi:hypothetical protein